MLLLKRKSELYFWQQVITADLEHYIAYLFFYACFSAVLPLHVHLKKSSGNIRSCCEGHFIHQQDND